VCSTVRMVSEAAAEEFLSSVAPQALPIVICPRLLTRKHLVLTPAGISPCFTAPLEPLLLQPNVAVAQVPLGMRPGAAEAATLRSQLPEPWPCEACLCKLQAIVLARRRISKRLVFVDIAPVAAAAEPDVLTNRRRTYWTDPQTQQPCRCGPGRPWYTRSQYQVTPGCTQPGCTTL
jgi:hypothetical protein